MKKLFYLLFAFTFVLACESPKSLEEPEQEVRIKIHAFYVPETESNKYPDSGSKVYLYYDIYDKPLIGYMYNGDGSLTDRKDGSTILPDQQTITDAEGNAVLISKYLDRMFTLVVESNYYPGRLGSVCYDEIEVSSFEGDINFTVTHYQ
jgi:hypothetical protein